MCIICVSFPVFHLGLMSVSATDFYLVLVLLHHGELSLQLLQHLKLRGLQACPVTPQLFQHL